MRIPILLVMLASCAFGQVTETTITDTVRVPVSSGLFNGIVDVRPSHLMTCGTSSYAPVPVQVGVTNGVLSLTLVPNSLCGPYDSEGNPASYYTARFVDRTRSVTWTETWVVPVSAVSVPLSTIHAAAPASASAAISLSQIAQGSATTNQVLAWSGTTWAPSDTTWSQVLVLAEQSGTPSDPTSGVQAKVYLKGDKLIIQFQEGSTVRYKYLDLTGTGVTWTHTTVAP